MRTAMGDDRLMSMMLEEDRGSEKPTGKIYARNVWKYTDAVNKAASNPKKILDKFGVDSLLDKKGDTPEIALAKGFARLDFAKSLQKTQNFPTLT